jgi:hypothetical protein
MIVREPSSISYSSKQRAKNHNRLNLSLSRLVAKLTETFLPPDIVSQLRTGREWKHWVNSLKPETLEDLTNAFDIYAGQLSAWRRSLVMFGTKPFPCTTCRHRPVPATLEATVAAHMEKHLCQIGYKEYLEHGH